MSRPPFVTFPVHSSSPGRRPSSADLVESVRRAHAAGELPAGCRLPPVRALEQQFGLSKNTAQSAYDELSSRGIVVARVREGVFVADSPLPPRAPNAPRASPPLAHLRAAPLASYAPRRDLLRLSAIFIDPSLLPREQLAECARSVLRTPGLDAFYDFQGYPPLREQIAARLRARGLDVSADEVVVTSGSQQALDCVVRALEHRRVALENPVYSHARFLFENLGATLTPLRLDPFAGPELDHWSERIALEHPSLLYAITSFQNPTGYSYTTHELTRLLEIAAREGVALLEDDWGSDMLSGGDYRPSLRMLGGANVLYVNSFTKKLLPSLRIGYLIAPRVLVPTLVAMKRLATLGNAWLMEATLSEFLDRGYYDTHLATVQQELDARYLHCLELLRAHMPDGVRWTLPGGGPTLWLDLPRSVNLVDLAARLAARGVEIESTASAFVGEPHLRGFRVSYSFLPPDLLNRALMVLAEELRRADGLLP